MMTATGRNRRIPKKENLIRRGLLRGSLALLAGTFLLANCSGNTNSSGPAAPLPVGQTGSILATGNTGNCYISDTSACGSTYKGSNTITALATLVSGGNYLYIGDNAGNIVGATVSNTSPQTPNSTSCPPTGASSKVLAIAAGNSALIYSNSSGVTIKTIATLPCTTFTQTYNTSSITNASGLTYNTSAGEFVGVTSNAQYFTCSTTSCTSPTALPSLQDTSPNITAIASDPTQSLVYILSIGASTNRIYFYYVSGNTLTYLGNYSGIELNYPSGIALFQGANPTQNYCTSGACTFMEVTNTGNSTITQYVLTSSGSGAQTSVSVNQFNNAYFDCDLIDSAAITAFPKYGSGNLLPQPDVFVGEQGTSYGSCLGTPSNASYGNNVTAYTIVGE